MNSMMQQTYEYYFRHLRFVKEGMIVESSASKEDEKIHYQECLIFIGFENQAQENK